jgi:hypothetical protein
MAKHKGPPNPRPEPAPRPIHEPVPPPPPTDPSASAESVFVVHPPTVILEPKVVSITATFTDIPGQDKQINQMEEIGYRHYESMALGGNEILLRFRKA